MLISDPPTLMMYMTNTFLKCNPFPENYFKFVLNFWYFRTPSSTGMDLGLEFKVWWEKIFYLRNSMFNFFLLSSCTFILQFAGAVCLRPWQHGELQVFRARLKGISLLWYRKLLFWPKKKLRQLSLFRMLQLTLKWQFLLFQSEHKSFSLHQAISWQFFLRFLSPSAVSWEQQTGFHRTNCHASDCFISGQNKITVKNRNHHSNQEKEVPTNHIFSQLWCLLGLWVYLNSKRTSSEEPPASTSPYYTPLLQSVFQIFEFPKIRSQQREPRELTSTFEQQ